MKNRQTGKWYNDNLCAFRCLALHRGHDIKSIEGPAQDFYKQWSDQPAKEFEGLNFVDFPAFERLFFVNLEVYNFTEDGLFAMIWRLCWNQLMTTLPFVAMDTEAYRRQRVHL